MSFVEEIPKSWLLKSIDKLGFFTFDKSLLYLGYLLRAHAIMSRVAS